jgi:phosphoglycerate dehydrogenase-like enzyme
VSDAALVLPQRFEGCFGTLPGPSRWYAEVDEMPRLAEGSEIAWAASYLSSNVAEALLDQAGHLRWLHYSSTGVEQLPLAQFEERGIVLTNGAGLYATPIAEHTVMCMLAARRNFPAMLRAHAAARWQPEVGGDQELWGTRVLIVGYGKLGSAIAQRLVPFGVEVLAARRSGDATGEGVLGVRDWRSVLGEVDFVILTLPSTPATRGILGADELRAMRPDAWVVNVARGSLVDERALVDALRAGRLGGAILDAFAQEPLPAKHPLWRMENVILSAHSSYRSRRLAERDLELFTGNLERVVDGRPLRNVVDLRAGY